MSAAAAANGAPQTLNESLRASRAALAGSGPLTLVLGNEAADLDSIACAASYAALLRDTGDAGALPLVAVPRADLALRADVTWLLRRLGVDAAALPFADEVDARALRDAGRLRAAVLVDHNRLSSAYDAALAPLVTRIVDHHADESLYSSAQKDIQLAQHIAAQAPALLDDDALRTLLLGAVLLDTGNLLGSSGRITQQDRDAAALLRRGMSQADADALFEALLAQRLDQSGLCTRDLLRRDYKEWTMNGWRVGVSSFGAALADVATRRDDPLADALAAWRTERSLDVLVVMASHGAGDAYRRELGVDAAPGGAAAELLPRMVRLASERALSTSQLALDPLPLPSPGWPAPGAAFAQRDRKASRKVVQPLLVAFFDQNAPKPS